ncbi:MAG: hypothetical protein QX189_05560 [Methylococcales bacterium]
MNHFTDAELQTLSAEIDSQLIELAKDPANDGITRHTGHTPKTIPSKQKQQLEQVVEQALGTKEPADSFMKKFARAAKQDLCVEGGVLYGQWKKYGDLENEKMVNTFSGILIGMGVSSAFLATAVVAVSVIVIHIGIKAFCEDCQ